MSVVCIRGAFEWDFYNGEWWLHISGFELVNKRWGILDVKNFVLSCLLNLLHINNILIMQSIYDVSQNYDESDTESLSQFEEL